jgi:hypothetical protein
MVGVNGVIGLDIIDYIWDYLPTSTMNDSQGSNWHQVSFNMKDLSELVKRWLGKLWKKRTSILLWALFGAVIGLNGVWLRPAKYRAELMLAVEEGESSGWQNLLAQFGLDVGGLNPGGIFEGESLVKLFETRYMVERTLLESMVVHGDSVLMVNYLYPYTKWGKRGAYTEMTWESERKEFTPLQDSLLLEVAEYVTKEVLDVYKPDKKLSLVYVNSIHENKYFAQAFTEAIVANTTSFFLESITAKARVNLEVLQNQRDSAEVALKMAIERNANAQDNAVNSIFQRAQVDKYASFVDLEIANALFIEITKNLTLAEIGLRKQTPLIQVVERPAFPLKKTGLLWWEWMSLGLGVGAAMGVYLVLTQPEKV